MAQLISATVPGSSRGGFRHQSRMVKARNLMARAHGELEAGNDGEAFEAAYQASLRCAGAIVAASPVAKRRRLPRGAWEQLALVGTEESWWSTTLGAYSRTRSRVLSGLAEAPSEGELRIFFNLVEDFLGFQEGGGTDSPQAA